MQSGAVGSKAVCPTVQANLDQMETEKRATLLSDAEAALAETHNALDALDRGDSKAALAALERATRKLDLVTALEPRLKLAPVAVNTTVLDLYAAPAAIRAVAPLIVTGRTELPKPRCMNPLHALVLETFVIPLLQVRAEARLDVADNKGRHPRMRSLVDAARQQRQLAEAPAPVRAG